MQNAELQPNGGKSPDHVALDETVIQLTDERYWLYAAVDPETNEFFRARLFSAQNEGVTSIVPPNVARNTTSSIQLPD